MTLADRPAAKLSKRQRKLARRGPKQPRDASPAYIDEREDPKLVETVDRAAILAAEAARLKARLRDSSPSEPWVEEQVQSVEESDADGQTLVRRLHQPGMFPPGGRETRMVKCDVCGVLHPPTIGGGPNCHEHAVERVMRVQEPALVRRYGEAKGRAKAGKLRARLERVARNIDEAFGASPSAVVIWQLQIRNLRMEERKLPSERKTDLRRYIKSQANGATTTLLSLPGNVSDGSSLCPLSPASETGVAGAN